MAHVSPDYKTKKAFKEAVKKGERVSVFSPGPFGCTMNGVESIEGPHAFHKWYARVQVENGYVTKVLS